MLETWCPRAISISWACGEIALFTGALACSDIGVALFLSSAYAPNVIDADKNSDPLRTQSYLVTGKPCRAPGLHCYPRSNEIQKRNSRSAVHHPGSRLL